MKNPASGLLRSNQSGSVAVEFALLGPAFIIMLMGVLQVGVGLQNYNAMRNVSADVARYAMVNYATGNKLSTTQLESYARGVASGAPYLLDDPRLTAAVTTPTVQRVTGASEMQLRLTYQIDSLLSGFGIDGPYLTFTRPIFVTG